jgi:hypothetical protein
MALRLLETPIMKAAYCILASALGLAAGCRSSALCIEMVECTANAHWDRSQCKCVVDTDASGCMQNVQCTPQAHWDPSRCDCVVDNVDGGCVQNVVCAEGAHWDAAQCKCVLNSTSTDLAGACRSECSGGTPGCRGMCYGCMAGEICCPWAGGPCLPTDGGCAANAGFKCSTATPAGLCPNQCYP